MGTRRGRGDCSNETSRTFDVRGGGEDGGGGSSDKYVGRLNRGHPDPGSVLGLGVIGVDAVLVDVELGLLVEIEIDNHPEVL